MIGGNDDGDVIPYPFQLPEAHRSRRAGVNITGVRDYKADRLTINRLDRCQHLIY
jgi:acyl-[acyl carrier protein]--UDP-N-acetylglucosamine O-acyltransferase